MRDLIEDRACADNTIVILSSQNRWLPMMDPSAVKAENKDQHPYTIVRATQFFEFVKQIVDYPTEGNTVRMPAALIQPMAADDVTSEVARIATNTAVNGTVEIGGPEQSRLDDLARIAGLVTGNGAG
jgi:hypothetical protein